MKKDFMRWHEEKSGIHCSGEERVYFHEREIWWCSLGANVGFEQDGKGERFARPVVVVKKFNKEIFWALPLTTRPKQGRYYFPIDLGDGRARSAILSQLRLLDAKRLKDKFSVLPQDQFLHMKRAVTTLLR
jgi:mRNA interferase MazF